MKNQLHLNEVNRLSLSILFDVIEVTGLIIVLKKSKIKMLAVFAEPKNKASQSCMSIVYPLECAVPHSVTAETGSEWLHSGSLKGALLFRDYFKNNDLQMCVCKLSKHRFNATIIPDCPTGLQESYDPELTGETSDAQECAGPLNISKLTKLQPYREL